MKYNPELVPLQRHVNKLNELLLLYYRLGFEVKLELEYPGDPNEPERYGRLFLRLLEIKVSDRRIQV